MRTLLASSALGALCATVAAQNYAYSPATASNTEQGSNSIVPFNTQAARYQQITGDLRGTPMNIQALALRRDGANTPYSTALARFIDVEVKMANSDWQTRSTTFANNYVGQPATVVTRKNIILPDLRNWVSTPSPWSVTIPFDTPFNYSGQNDLLYEFVIHTTTSGGAYYLDAHVVGTVPGTATTYGAGCVATGRTVRSTIAATIDMNMYYNPPLVSIGWSFTNGAATAPSAVLIGTSRIDVPVPGLCSNLYINNIVVTLTGVSGGSGTFTAPGVNFLWQPAFAGGKLFAQGASADAGQSPIPATMTNGSEVTVPAYPDRLVRVYAISATATTGTHDTAPFGLATRFTY
jgi:hypothetical protein